MTIPKVTRKPIGFLGRVETQIARDKQLLARRALLAQNTPQQLADRLLAAREQIRNSSLAHQATLHRLAELHRAYQTKTTAEAIRQVAGDVIHTFSNILGHFRKITDELTRKAAQLERELEQIIKGQAELNPQTTRAAMKQINELISGLTAVSAAMVAGLKKLEPVTYAGFTNGKESINVRDEVREIVEILIPGLAGTREFGRIMVVGLDSLPANAGIKTGSSRFHDGLGNMINNSIQAGATEIVLTIRLEKTGDSRARVVFEISDNGPGIPVEKLPEIGLKVVKSDKREAGGTGLFRFFSQLEGVDRGFEVVESTSKGVKIRFWLPFVVCEPTPRPASRLDYSVAKDLRPEQAAGLKSVTIDDNPIALSISTAYADSIGLANVDLLNPGFAELQERLSKEQPQVIIADMRMPGFDGIDLIKWTLAQAWGQQVEFVIVTGHPGDLEARQAARKSGITVRFVGKTEPAEIAAAIKHAAWTVLHKGGA